MTAEMLKKATELCEKLQSCFRGVSSIAWDNAYDEFTQNMDSYEKEFGDAIAELKTALTAPDEGKPFTHDDRMEFLGQMIDIVEDFLDDKGVEIENPDRDEEDDNAAIIYGTDYDTLSSGFEGKLIDWGFLKKEDDQNE